MRALAVVVALVAAGCFKPNLADGNVTCGTNRECPAGQTCFTDNNRCYAHPPQPGDDLAMPQTGDDMASGSTDMAIMSCATNGARVCADSTHSAVCAGGVVMIDRACPPGSTCSAGLCGAPNGGASCVATSKCAGGAVCDLFVGAKNMLSGSCAAPISGATGGFNAKCNAAGYDATCTTGICAALDATTRACLHPCSGNADCGGGGVNCQPLVLPTAVEGASTTGLKFCVK